MKLREFFTTEASIALGRGAGAIDDIAKAGDDVVRAGTNTMSQRVGRRIATAATVDAKTKDKDKDNNQEVAIIFGRFNPPHVGHKEAWIKASESPIWYLGTNQATVGPTDPLPFEVKVECIKAIWPDAAGHIVPEQTWWTLAAHVFKKHGPVTLYVVTDEKDAKVFVPGIQSQNGKQGPHGFYEFKNIEWRRAERISSATDLREAVLENNRKKFSIAAGVSSETPVMGKPFFDLVAEYLLPYKDQILASIARKAAKAAKTAKNENMSINRSNVDMDKVTARARELFKKGANESQVKAELLKQGVPPRLADQAVQAGQTNEEAAGVGIITKQNTTPDVNASTPYKNLKAFGLVKEAFDEIENAIMSETKGHLTKRQHQPSRGMHLVSDAERWNGDYVMYRLGMAVASTDGTNEPNVDQSSWIGKFKSTHPYTDKEAEMLKKAYKAVGANHIDLNHGDNRSLELDSTNKVSPVPKRKKNKYGV